LRRNNEPIVNIAYKLTLQLINSYLNSLTKSNQFMENRFLTTILGMKQLVFTTLVFLFMSVASFAQVTSSSIGGVIKDKKSGETLIGASIIAVHVPSGTRYAAVTDVNGSFFLPSVRVGGPYKVTTTYVGYKENIEDNVYASLGTTATVNMILQEEGTVLDAVEVTYKKNDIFSGNRTGAATTFGRENLNSLPTLNRNINDITKYNAYGNGRSFGGQDPRYNNFTIDGSVFNNGFGLGSSAAAGGRTGSSAISLDALEEVQLNIAPFDIRQSGFAGAAINAVTRSGTNEISGSAYTFIKNKKWVGTSAAGTALPPTLTNITENSYGFRIGGPLIKNKLFFFANGEFLKRSIPALDYVLNRSGATGNVSRTTAADLEDLSSFMLTNFNYDMGAIDGYNNDNKSNKFLARIDYNINDNNKLAFRYSHHDSEADQLISQSNSGNLAGNGNRTNRAEALSAQNTGYKILDNTRSFVAELNSTFKNKLSNNLIVTYNKQIEDRKYRTGLFPTVDILKDGVTYTTIGFDPFTPDNKLNYSTFNATNNLTYYAGKHKLTGGLAYEYFKSNNLFYFSSNGVWVYNSIADFKAAALESKNNPTASAITAARFNYRYSLLPDGSAPWQTLQVHTTSAYVQDQYAVNNKLNITYGVRADYLAVAQTANSYYNSRLTDTLKGKFSTADGQALTLNTSLMPKAKVYFSPRFGFNYDVFGDKKTQIRGGTGLFLTRVPYVLISNQLGNNGVNIGAINVTNTKAYPFTTDPTKYKPTNTDASKLTGYTVNANDENLKFPQLWKTNIAIDQKLPLGFVVTLEGIYNKFYNQLNYYDANLRTATTNFTGSDTRLRYPNSVASTNSRFLNTTIGNAYVLSNNSKGDATSFTFKLERNAQKGLTGMFGYTYGLAKDLAFVASTVSANVPSVRGVNYLDLSYSDNDLRNRFVGYLNYRINYGGNFGGSTMFTLGCVSASGFKTSYIYSNDANGDGLTNDLVYVPASASELNFNPLTTSGITFTAQQQRDALDAFINNSKYLSSRRSNYAERNGAEFPWLTRFDFTVTQDFYVKVGDKKNTIQIRADIINASNLLNDKWGVGNDATTTAPLRYISSDANGKPTYTLATQVDQATGQTILVRDAFIKSKSLSDVYQIQLGLRYIFN
jgi:hypothetical protein